MCPHSDGGHPATIVCINEQRDDLYMSEPNCGNTSGGGDGSPSGDGSSGGGGSNTSSVPDDGNNAPVFTDPVFEEETNSEDNPCDKIKNGTDNAIYKQKFKDLNKSQKFNLDYESGFYMENSDGVDQYIDGVSDGNNKLIIPNNALNATHVHNNNPKTLNDGTPYDGHVKMFSPKDVSKLFTTIKNSNTISPEDGFLVMISNEGIFAITLLEPLNLPLDLNANWNTFIKNYYDKALSIIVDYQSISGRKDALEKMLLMELKRLGLDNSICLFEGTVENEIDPDINNDNIKWTRKKLKKTFIGHSVDEIPCN
jgi:hypothetical protein